MTRGGGWVTGGCLFSLEPGTWDQRTCVTSTASLPRARAQRADGGHHRGPGSLAALAGDILPPVPAQAADTPQLSAGR